MLCTEKKDLIGMCNIYYESFDELPQELVTKFKYNGSQRTDCLNRAKQSYVNLINELNKRNDVLVSDYFNNKTKIKIKYGKCGHTTQIGVKPDNYKFGCDCSICNGTEVQKGVNDIATTHPYKALYFANEEDTYKYTAHSNKSVEMKCIICGHYVPSKKIANLTKRGFSCPHCSDGISYPEKLMAIVLDILNVKYSRQLRYNNGQYKYDFYLLDFNAIFETNGNQHYEGWGKNKEDLQRQLFIDADKKAIAINILEILEENYNVVDCRYSTLEWCRPNIEKALSKYVDMSVLTDEDWLEIDIMCQNSNLINVVNYYNTYKCTASIISEELNIPIPTVCKYLNKGVKLGLCDYDGRSNMAYKIGHIPHNKGVNAREMVMTRKVSPM